MFKKILILTFITINSCNSMNILNWVKSFGHKPQANTETEKPQIDKTKLKETLKNTLLETTNFPNELQGIVLEYLKPPYPKYKYLRTIKTVSSMGSFKKFMSSNFYEIKYVMKFDTNNDLLFTRNPAQIIYSGKVGKIDLKTGQIEYVSLVMNLQAILELFNNQPNKDIVKLSPKKLEVKINETEYATFYNLEDKHQFFMDHTISPDGKYLAACLSNGDIMIFEKQEFDIEY